MLSNRLKISDSSTMLSGYAKSGQSVKYSDTASMLSNRLKISDTTTMLSGYARNGNLGTMAYQVQSNYFTGAVSDGRFIHYTDTVYTGFNPALTQWEASQLYSASGSGVTSFNSRTGAVTPAYGDYYSNTSDNITNIDLHYDVLRGKGATSTETFAANFTVTALANAGQTTVTVSSSTGMAVNQLLTYMGTDSNYYTASVKSIVGGTITLNSALQQSIPTGSNLHAFYKNESHPDTFGFYAIADNILRYNKTKYKIDRNCVLSDTIGSPTITTNSSNDMNNPGSANVISKKVVSSNGGVDAVKGTVYLSSTGTYIVKFYINTHGKNATLKWVYDGIATTQSVNTNEPVLVTMPMYLYDTARTVTISASPDNTGDSLTVNYTVPVLKSTGNKPNLNNGKIVLYGDSWFANYGIYQRLTAKLPQASIVNSGVGGYTSSDLITAFNTYVTPYNPDVVIIIVGTNDYYGGVSALSFTKSINQLKQLVANLGAHLIILTSSVGSAQLNTTRFDLSRQYANFTRYYDENIVPQTISGVLLGNNLNSLTFGTHLTGSSYNGSTAITIATDATSANTASTIVARDASNNFSASAITATTFIGTLSGTASNATTWNNLVYGGLHSTGTLDYLTGYNATNLKEENYTASDVGTFLSGIFLKISDTASMLSSRLKISDTATMLRNHATYSETLTGKTISGSSNTLSNIANSSLSNSTISGISLGSNLNSLSATDASLTFSGSYNGSTARTVGLNLSNTNNFLAKQTVGDGSSFKTRLRSDFTSSRAHIDATNNAESGFVDLAIDGTNLYLNSGTGGNIILGGTTTVSGTVTATSFTESSDIRLKNVLVRNYSKTRIDNIQYTWKDGRDKYLHYGYSAQQVKEVLPYAVVTDGNGFLSVDYGKVNAYKIAQLENEIAELKKLLHK